MGRDPRGHVGSCGGIGGPAHVDDDRVGPGGEPAWPMPRPAPGGGGRRARRPRAAGRPRPPARRRWRGRRPRRPAWRSRSGRARPAGGPRPTGPPRRRCWRGGRARPRGRRRAGPARLPSTRSARRAASAPTATRADRAASAPPRSGACSGDRSCDRSCDAIAGPALGSVASSVAGTEAPNRRARRPRGRRHRRAAPRAARPHPRPRAPRPRTPRPGPRRCRARGSTGRRPPRARPPRRSGMASGPPAPPMSSASVTTSPVNPSSPRSRSVTIRRLTVAGCAASSAGTSRWPGITARTPAAIAARNGTSSRSRRTSAVAATVGSARCESTAVAPCPGKCLAHAATPASCSPDVNAATCRATSAGSAPNDRTPMTGLSGSLLTSAHGARSRSIPEASSTVPSARPTPRVRSSSSIAPRAALPGTDDPVVASRRVTSPPSSSRATTTSARTACSPAATAGDVGVAVRAVQAHAAQARVGPPPQPRGHLGAGKRRQQRPEGEPAQVRVLAHPFTAPAVRPDATRRWTNRKKMITGTVMSVEPP